MNFKVDKWNVFEAKERSRKNLEVVFWDWPIFWKYPWTDQKFEILIQIVYIKLKALDISTNTKVFRESLYSKNIHLLFSNHGHTESSYRCEHTSMPIISMSVMKMLFDHSFEPKITDSVRCNGQF